MHGRNSPRRRASHDDMPNMRTRRWRKEEGLRKAGVATRRSGPPDEARFRHRAQKIVQHRRGASRSKKSPHAYPPVKMRSCPHKICHWATWVATIGQIMGDKPVFHRLIPPFFLTGRFATDDHGRFPCAATWGRPSFRRPDCRFAAPPKCTAATPRVVAHHMTTCPICVREGGGRKRACGRRASQRDDPARLTKPASATERKRSSNIVAAQAAVKSPHMPTHP